MSKYLEELFNIYLKVKNSDNEKIEATGNYQMFLAQLNTKAESIEINASKYKIGELYFADNFIFLLINKIKNNCVGYKVSEWVEFATNRDFIFEFAEDKWLAIMEKLYIPFNKIGGFVGIINEKYIKILSDYENNNVPIPAKYTGLTVSEKAIQYKFRKKELEEVEEFLILSFDEFANKIGKIVNTLSYPKAAYSDKVTARGRNFVLFFDKSKNILFLKLTEESLKKSKVIKIKFFNDIYLFYNERDTLQIDIVVDYIDVGYIADNLEIIDE